MSSPRPPERGLGRGLGALIPQRAADRPALQEVPVDAVRPNPSQPRMVIEPEALAELAESITEHGVLQPIVVSRAPDGAYQLIAGERRLRAARQAGLATVPAVVKEATPRAALEMALVENIQRRDLNPLEEALAYRQLLEEHGLTQEALAQRLGKSRVAVTNTLRLLQLPDPVKDALLAAQITEGHARALLLADGDAVRVALLARVVRDGLSVRQTEELARRANAAPDEDEAEAAAVAGPDPDRERLENAFRQALGTRVNLVRRGSKGGRLVIHFFSDDELRGLYEAIVGDQPD